MMSDNDDDNDDDDYDDECMYSTLYHFGYPPPMPELPALHDDKGDRYALMRVKKTANMLMPEA